MCETVYPACAGIDPYYTVVLAKYTGLPRMRGDRPSVKGYIEPTCVFTPHARGSTLINYILHSVAYVYPACAGIDRI